MIIKFLILWSLYGLALYLINSDMVIFGLIALMLTNPIRKELSENDYAITFYEKNKGLVNISKILTFIISFFVFVYVIYSLFNDIELISDLHFMGWLIFYIFVPAIVVLIKYELGLFFYKIKE